MRAMRVLVAVSMTAAAAAWAANCGGDGGVEPPPTPPSNRAPVAVGSLAPLTIDVGASASVDVASNFSDPDGDALAYSAETSDAAAATASVSGSTVAVTGVSAGTATLTVTARDPGGLGASQTAGVTVEAVNLPPTVVGGIEDRTLAAGDTVTADVAELFEDPEGDPLTFSAASSDTAVATASASESTVTVAALSEGTAAVTVTAADTAGNSNRFEFGVTVEAPNRAPEITDSIPPQTLLAGDTVRLDASEHFSDPDGDALAYSAETSDAAAATASVSGSTVAVTGVSAGTATLTVTARDPGGLGASQTAGVTVEAVNLPPTVVGGIEDRTLAAGDTVTADVAELFEDPEGDPLTFSAASSDTAVATASASESTVTVAALSEGTAAVTVTAADTAGNSNRFEFGVTVEAPNRAPEITDSIPPQTLLAGDTVRLDASEHFSDPDGDALAYSAETSDAAAATASVSGSTVAVTGVSAGTATLTVTARDPGGLGASQTAGVTVEAVNLPPTVVGGIEDRTLAAGDTVTADVAELFEDPEGDPLTFSAASSDTAVATASASESTVTVAALSEGTAAVTVTAADTAGNSNRFEFGVTVEAPNRAPEITDSIPPQTLLAGDTVRLDASEHFSDPDGDALAYSAETSDAAAATASVSGSTVAVTGVSAGTATLTVTARDPGGLGASQTAGVTVEAVNLPPTVVGGIEDRTLAAGDTVTADVAELFEDPEGDPLTFSAASSDTAVATASASESTVTVAALSEGTAAVTVTAADTAGNSNRFEFGVTVEAPNRAPEITDSIPPQTLLAGDTVRLDASEHFSDPDGDALAYSAISSNAKIVTALALGENGSMIEIGGQASGSVTLTVSAADPEGLTAAQQVIVTVEAPPPAVADTIPTHDMVVDSMVPLDMSPYFEGGELTYTAATSDETVAVASVDGSTVTTTGTGASEDTISVAMLTVTATNASGGSVTQDSIMVRVHREEYDTLPGLSINEDGNLLAVVAGSTVTLTNCLRLNNFPVGDQPVTVFWSEWQRAVGGGWITVQDNEKVNTLGGEGHSICPIRLDQEHFPVGVYRLVGRVKIGDDTGFYTTPAIEKKPEG